MKKLQHSHILSAGSCSPGRQLNWVVIIQLATNSHPPPLLSLWPPTPISFSASRRNTSHMTHLSLYLCPEYLCGHVTEQKGQHCFPQHPFQVPTTPTPRPPLLTAPFNHQDLKVTVTLCAGETVDMLSSQTHFAANSAAHVMNSLFGSLFPTLLTVNQAGGRLPTGRCLNFKWLNSMRALCSYEVSLKQYYYVILPPFFP